MKNFLRRHRFLACLTLVPVILFLGAAGYLFFAAHRLPEGDAGTPRDTAVASPAHGTAIAASRVLLETQRREASYPSLAVAVAIDEELLWSEAVGWADLEAKTPASTTTQYAIGSVSKPLTATAAMLLVEQGVLALDSPISTYLPRLPADYGKVTMRQLLSHQAGVRHYKPALLPPFFNESGINTAYPSVEEGLTIFIDDPLLFEPDTSFNYSTYGYSLASRVMEVASGENFPQLMSRLLFQPLKLSSSEVDRKSPPPAKRARSYYGLRRLGVIASAEIDSSSKWAGGGLVSTPTDLARFASRLRAGEIIPENRFVEMTTPRQLANGEMNEQHYGLGWRQGTMGIPKGAKTTTPLIHHGGTALGSQCMLMIAPDPRVVVAVCGNAFTGGSGPLLMLAADMARLFMKDSGLGLSASAQP